jgi:flagellar biosynthetic protein FliR
MHGELTLSASTLIAFALVLSRMAGVFAFVPMPVKDAGPPAARILLAFACTLTMFPRWPVLNADDIGIGTMALWMITEMALGTAIGLMVSFVSEFLVFGAQVLSLQAGYGYASVIDPTTQADSNVLPVLAQLMAGLLFFTTGLHRYVISAFALSLEAYPPGRMLESHAFADTVINLGGTVFSLGLRLAFPIIALLLMTEISLGLLSKINSQLHVSTHAFSAKMLITLLCLMSILVTAPSLYQAFSTQVLQGIGGLLRH